MMLETDCFQKNNFFFYQFIKHYSLQEITDNLININIEETRRIVGILKKYGVVKAVKKNKPDFDDLSNEDIVLTDVIDSSSDIEYIFDYVGVVVIEGQVFKCYPKYIKSTEHLFENLKQVLKVIKKYNASNRIIFDASFICLAFSRENDLSFPIFTATLQPRYNIT